MARQFVSQGIWLQINPLKQLQNEEEFRYENNSIASISWFPFIFNNRILVQLDGNK